MVQNRSLNYLKHQKIENLYVNYLEKNNLFDEVRNTLKMVTKKKNLTLPDRSGHCHPPRKMP
jgi:hypothetical protein